MQVKLSQELFLRRFNFKKYAWLLGVVAAVALVAWLVFSLLRSGAPSAEQRFQDAYNAGRLDEALNVAAELGAGSQSMTSLQAIAAIYIKKALASTGPDRADSLAAALKAARAAETINPKDAETQRILGYVLEMQGDLGGAERSYKASLEADPKNSATLSQYAALLARQGKAEAGDYFERAVAADGENPQTRVLYASFLYSQGKFEDVIRQASSVASSTRVGFALDANRLLAKAFLKLGDFDGAAAASERAVALAPDSAPALVALGETKLATLFKKPGEPFNETLTAVRDLADRAAAIDPTSAAAAFLGFKAAYSQADTSAAAAYADQVKALLPNDGTLTQQEKDAMTLLMGSVSKVKLTVSKAQ